MQNKIPKSESNITLIKNKPTMFTNCTTEYLIVDSVGNMVRQFTTVQSAKAALDLYGPNLRIVECAVLNGTVIALFDE